ncbi:hypothetical protein ACIPJS_38390 [Streptomyces sp. NPDC086783]|uniref:hypothetical protein n=1 Tax=Streptomyces sp. NPDC086783 TaxID=3365758 RepID=UPI003830AD79
MAGGLRLRRQTALKTSSSLQVDDGPDLAAVIGPLRPAARCPEFPQAIQDVVVLGLGWTAVVTEGQLEECLIVVFGEVETDVSAAVGHDRRHPVREDQAIRQPVLLTSVSNEGLAPTIAFRRRYRVTPPGDANC